MYHINPNYLKRIQNESFYLAPKIKLIKSQKDLLLLLAKGLTINQIASTINIKENNIKKRTLNLYKKFEVSSRKELILKAIKLNFIKFKDISPKFRKRFFKNEVTQNKPYTNAIKSLLNNEEVKVLTLLLNGYKKKGIVETLGFCNIHYLNMVLYSIFAKLNAKNKIQAICIAIKNGIIKI